MESSEIKLCPNLPKKISDIEKSGRRARSISCNKNFSQFYNRTYDFSPIFLLIYPYSYSMFWNIQTTASLEFYESDQFGSETKHEFAANEG